MQSDASSMVQCASSAMRDAILSGGSPEETPSQTYPDVVLSR
jgi:hypothetical protein